MFSLWFDSVFPTAAYTYLSPENPYRRTGSLQSPTYSSEGIGSTGRVTMSSRAILSSHPLAPCMLSVAVKSASEGVADRPPLGPSFAQRP